jgi:predicted adenylyl cyclase CyaB
MARNIEIKARLADIEATLALARLLADGEPQLIAQDDTFFNAAKGRLKLRAFADGRGELIYYERPDQAGPKTSFYVLSPTASPDTLREALTLAHGQIGRVRKLRTLLLAGRTRIHLDRVDGLGDFMELEVVLADDEAMQDGVAEAHALMARLGIAADQLIDVAYLDLLQAKG